MLWRNTHDEESPVILVRTLQSGGTTHRVIMLAVPNNEFGMIASQVEMIDPVPVDGGNVCPSRGKCGDAGDCLWNALGGNYDR